MACLCKSVLLSLLLIVKIYCQRDIRKPPMIITPRTQANFYFFSTNLNPVINCSADGQPVPTYRWLKDDKDIIPSQFVSFDSSTGVLRISNFSEREEGTYMCIASNNFVNGQGSQYTVASWSASLQLFKSRVDPFDSTTQVMQQATEYDYVKMSCNSKTVMGATIIYNWYDNNRNGIPLDNGRLFTDQSGNLHFTYVLKKDEAINYHCGISVDQDPLIRLGTENKLSVNTRNPIAIQPQKKYSNSGVKGLRFTTVKLECVFSGYDPMAPNFPTIQWQDAEGQAITTGGKYSLSSNGRVLSISNVQEDDERYYTCSARNSAGAATDQVFLNVTSGPIFLNGVPIDQTVPEDTDVQFNCDTRSAIGENPPGTPIWLINGVPFGPQNDPNKFQLSEDKKILTIVKVKKATDIMCVQCIVSNSEGRVLANACLNVILPITITTQPKSLVQEITYGGSVDLTVTASTDPSMTLSYRWEFNNVSYTGSDAPPNVYYNPNTMQAYINTSGLSEEKYVALAGSYRRVIYHLYESKVVEIEVILADRQAAAHGGVAFDLWIIGLIIGLILLIVVILIIIFLICRKKQEGDYNVDKKETGAGLDPEKELKDKNFHAYSGPAADYDYPDSKPPGGDPEYDDAPIGGDDESLGEYGKEDFKYFNEDGSFIGIYQSKQQTPPKPTESSI